VPVAIVTASDSGIGKASAVALAEAGFDVGVTWNTDEAGAADTAREVEGHGRRAEVRHLDVTRLPEAGDVVDELAEALGGLDVLVNNAGRGSSTPVLEMDFDEWRDVLAVNLDGAFVCAQRAARRMVDAGGGGRIVNITSVSTSPSRAPLRTAPRRRAWGCSPRSWLSSSPSRGSWSTRSRPERSPRR
jgi:NAD(P)-dependent dehydrogenase (short-subunit alcohol dehydrogenase family)